jgi:hypothetical protein
MNESVDQCGSIGKNDEFYYVNGKGMEVLIQINEITSRVWESMAG